MEGPYDDPSDQHSVVETTENDELHQLGEEPDLGLDGASDRYPLRRVSSSRGHSRPQSLRPRSSGGRSVGPMGLANGFPSSGLKPTSAQIPTVIIPRSRPIALPYSSSRSGLVYDSQMRFHVDSTETNDDAHPEKPGRILEIFDELVKADLVHDPQSATETECEYHLVRIPVRRATKAELCLIHSPDHVDFVKSTQDFSAEEIREHTNIGAGEASIYWHKLTWLCACLSAGGAIEATRAVVLGQVKNAVAVIRPPGHHAEHSEPSGFCFFNNVPIATRVVQAEYPDKARKVVILDWDVHHGNGIQHAFEDDPNVLYISLHVYNRGNFYPFSTDADHTHCGTGAGQGRNVNIPWSEQGMTDADYILAFQQVVMPICIEFNPDLVMISAGFDAASGDPLGGCFVSPAAYAHMTHMLMQLANGKVVACLEGGYNLRSIAVSALAMTRTLMGEPPERLRNLTPSPSAVSTIQRVIRTQSAFWKCLYPKDLSMRVRGDGMSQRLHDFIRDQQTAFLWKEHMMSPASLHTGLFKSFKNQVLVSQNHYQPVPLLLIFHDPPEVVDMSERKSNVVELHNAVLTDSVKQYIAWAHKNDFAVIDVNMPKHITKEDDDKSHVDGSPAAMGGDDERSSMCRGLAYYLWHNYIECYDHSHVFLMGVGDAFYGLIELLKNREDALGKVDLTIGFVAEQSLRGVTNPTDEDVAKIYYKNSLVYIAENHTTFDVDARKPKRRHGRLKKSDATDLQGMLEMHFYEITERLLEETEAWRANQPADYDEGDVAPTEEVDAMDLNMDEPRPEPLSMKTID